MTDLRTSLQRLADSTEPLPVDDDLWGRARAARRRAQVLAAAAVVAVVVTVGGGFALWQAPDREARTAAGQVPGGAIPRVITDVPAGLEPTSDLAVGRASVAFLDAEQDPIVVTAVDGVAHRLDLGEWGPDRAAYALSPDGSRLAYQQPSDAGTRLTVLDLRTGRAEALLLDPEHQVQVDYLSWSPGSDWLGWVSPATGATRASAGTIRADGAEAGRFVLKRNASSVAVSDGGDSVVGHVNGGLTLLPLHGSPRRLWTDGLVGAGAFSPDGGFVAVSTGVDTASYTFDLASRRLLFHPFPDGTIGASVVRPLGWIDDRLQLLLVQPVDDSDGELVITTPEVDDQSTWRRRVGAVELETLGVPNSLSVAVDLVPDLDGTSSQELTHDFGDTSRSSRTFLGIETSLAIGLGVALAIAVLMGLRSLWRRLRG